MTPSGRLVVGTLLGALLGVVLLAAGCSGSSSPQVASLGSTTTTTGQLNQPPVTASPADYAKDLAYAQCMRKHGVPTFPDPNAQGSFLPGPPTPQIKSANATCQHLEPNGGVQTAAEQKEALQIGLKAAACMRAHGVPDFPDPNAQGDLRVRGNPNSPQFERAMKACQTLFNEFGAVP